MRNVDENVAVVEPLLDPDHEVVFIEWIIPELPRVGDDGPKELLVPHLPRFDLRQRRLALHLLRAEDMHRIERTNVAGAMPRPKPERCGEGVPRRIEVINLRDIDAD